ncbi:RNA-directed DNA polymerase [Priestia sp. YIM B13486]|uniref:RNA-directed DNA polymerase n=1 Tax=Priestia sp. YIM B13486 TaxID=3366304 RepID=UPI00366EEB10
MEGKIINKSRFILTDVLPYEVPLIFSNTNLYSYIQHMDKSRCKIWEDYHIEKLFSNNRILETEPFNFLIYKNDVSTRSISLIHPLSQLHMLKVIEKYDLEIINFFKQNAIFSLRYPSKINNKDIQANDTLSKNMLALLDEESDESHSFPASYFVKRKFTRINDFLNSPILKKLEIKYSKLLKIDFQNCFYNIYTHSIDWSYLGDIKLAKESRNGVRISSIIDRVLQASNYGETNGIVVGPEFSRYMAEFVLCNIDNIVYRELKRKKLIYKNHYEIVRFMDDIFVFCNEDSVANEIKKVIEEASFRYRLSINESKSKLEVRPFLKNTFWESKARANLIKFYDALTQYKGNNYKVISNMIQELTDEIKLLLINYDNEQHKIIGYVLRFFENKIKLMINYIDTRDASIRSYILFKLIDLFQYILIFSVNTSNILKYIKLTLFLFLNNKGRSEDVIDLLYKKSLEILKYHSKKKTEVLNLLLSLTFFPKDLPEKLLLRFLDEDKDYFTLATIAFYVSTKERKYKYKKVRGIINLQINKTVEELLGEYGDIKKNINKIILSKDFYLLYDFYTCKILFRETKQRISKIKKVVDGIKIPWQEKNLYNFFIDFIQEFNNPFMNWNAEIKDIIEILERKSSKIDTSNSG